jgi:hypothetical protein
MLTRVSAAKASITLWALLVWAYKRQGVQYETDRAFSFAPAGAYAGDFLGASGGHGWESWEGRGCINGAGTIAHRDAHVLHAIVRGMKPSKRRSLIETAAVGKQPVWDPVIPHLRVVPLWKGPKGRIERHQGQLVVMGKLLSMYPGQRFPGDAHRDRHAGFGHWIAFEGCDEHEGESLRAAARADYEKWWQALFELYRQVWFDGAFERWKITSIGAKREPWHSAA